MVLRSVRHGMRMALRLVRHGMVLRMVRLVASSPTHGVHERSKPLSLTHRENLSRKKKNAARWRVCL